MPLITGRALSSANINYRHSVSYLFSGIGEVFGVSLSAAMTQTLLAREIIAKILTSTVYIDTLPTELQAKATTGWMCTLNIVFQCQTVVAMCLFLSALPIGELPLQDTLTALQPEKPPAVHNMQADEKTEVQPDVPKLYCIHIYYLSVYY
ncbi:hypothetical protein DFH08DRAFT_818719 [Mycena albidolilacea]|uniref:Uncharacterized protein n=1 Tax=Mycena albidolilacea TaxID=1033008 RepID=A0AAD7EFR2_9AGAR|nr:hypothetical protein DFH08DRAFT_818719 [Mycena albidolilacea]